MTSITRKIRGFRHEGRDVNLKDSHAITSKTFECLEVLCVLTALYRSRTPTYDALEKQIGVMLRSMAQLDPFPSPLPARLKPHLLTMVRIDPRVANVFGQFYTINLFKESTLLSHKILTLETSFDMCTVKMLVFLPFCNIMILCFSKCYG